MTKDTIIGINILGLEAKIDYDKKKRRKKK